jgi:PAT family beta-lactamase induction signal transducer AmpG
VSSYFEVLQSRRVAVVLLFGFSSGLPLMLTDNTLQARLADEGVAVSTIGLFTLVGIPYTFKFLWAPLMDRYVPPWLGRRRGWALVTQVLLMACIVAMASPAVFAAPAILGVLALTFAFISASQDIVIDAYRADTLPPRERGAGASAVVLGYRIAMIMSGGLALVVADLSGWVAAYYLMAALMLVGVGASFWGREPPTQPPSTLMLAVVGPFRDLLANRAVWGLLLLAVLYKLGDTTANAMTTTFLLRGAGFPLAVVGGFNAGWGLAMSVSGVVVGGVMLARWSLFRALLVFGALQAVSNLGFVALALVGPSYPLLAATVGFEQFAGGMGTAAFVAFLTALCSRRFSATQYALLSALVALGRVFGGPPSGFLAEAAGWAPFFAATFVAALPALWLLVRLRSAVEALDAPPVEAHLA